MAVNPVFDLAEEAFKDYSVEQIQHYRIQESLNGNRLKDQHTDQTRTIRFRIDDMNNWLNVGRSYIRFVGKLARRTGVNDDYTQDDNAGAKALANNLAACFRRATLRANGIIVENATEDKSIDVTVHDLINNDSEYAKSFGSMFGYMPQSENPGSEEGRQILDGTTSEVAGVSLGGNRFASSIHTAGGDKKPDGNGNNGNLSQLDRSLRSATKLAFGEDSASRKFEVLLPLNKVFHVLKAHDKVVRGIQWEIELEFEDSNKMIRYSPGLAGGDHNVSPYFWFQDRCAELYLEKVTPRIEVRNVLNNLLLNGFKKSINYEDVQVYKQPLGHADQAYDWRIATTVSRPTKLYVCAKWNHRDQATYYNSQTFDYVGMKRIYVRVNGIKYPDEDYEMTPSGTAPVLLPESGHHRVVMDLMKLKGLDVSEHTDMLNRGSLINAQNWVTHYPIYSFDLTKYPGDALFTGSSEIMVHIERDNNNNPAFSVPVQATGFPQAPGVSAGHQFTLYAVLAHEKVVELSMSQNESSIIIR